jgi:hypothetical protein
MDFKSYLLQGYMVADNLDLRPHPYHGLSTGSHKTMRRKNSLPRPTVPNRIEVRQREAVHTSITTVYRVCNHEGMSPRDDTVRTNYWETTSASLQ